MGLQLSVLLHFQLCLVTLVALGPLSPSTTSNWTASPSLRVRYPSALISEKCTNTSSPFSRSIKPNPFSGLNHFTTPASNAIPQSKKPFWVGYHTRLLVSTEPGGWGQVLGCGVRPL